MAFALQSIQKRLPKILGPLIAAAVLTHAVVQAGDATAGKVAGMRVLVALALGLGVVSLLVQLRFLPHRAIAPRGASASALLRGLHPTLRRLLVAEVFTRWCDWLIREFVVIYVVLVRGVSIGDMGGLIALQHLVALATYLPIGQLTGRVSARPFIGLTFVFFALFPLALALTPNGWLPLAFVINGLREIGEPARKALITSLLAEETRARGVGLYWGVRSVAMCPAALVGAAVWASHGPETLLFFAFALGCVGAMVFWFLAPRWD